MKVLLLARSLETGGMQRQLVELAKRLPASGHEVQVTLFYGGNAHFEEELRAAGVPVAVLGKSGRWDVLSFLRRLARHVREARPDVVYSFLTVPNVIAALLRPAWGRTDVVWGVRDSNVDFRQYTWALRAGFLASLLFVRGARRVVFNSAAGRDHYIAAGYPAARAVVVPNGIDVHRFAHDAAGRQRLRAAWSISEEAPLVGVVARLDPMKGHETFIEAVRLLAARRPHVRFVCVGPGPEPASAQLRERSRRAGVDGALVWAGEVLDMPAAFSALDVLCLPSWSAEGFPNVVGEGMACGLPVVVTTVGDAAVVAGEAGIAVPPRDPEALADALERVLDDVARDAVETAARSRRRIVDEFSGEHLVERTLAVLQASDRSADATPP